MSDVPLLVECPKHGRTNHFYFAYPNAWVCRIDGCRHYVPAEDVA